MDDVISPSLMKPLPTPI